ncbi:hypothetical protein LguiA_004754 [Lonicera macranthoides]
MLNVKFCVIFDIIILLKLLAVVVTRISWLLVLEYMPNGSLEKWLYSHNYCLTILERLNIMIDVAFALEYLHHGQTMPILHCDLKHNNVLLDKDMSALVCDFGIAKLLEYIRERIVSTKADV